MANEAGDLDAAITHFRAFFHELDRTFVERSQALDQIALALLAREHVLLTGPPGTAKSGLVRGVVNRIVDRQTGAPSVFARQLTESTVQTDLVGPIDFKVLTETGRTEHFTDEGMLGAIHAHLDEVFDGRDMLLRTTLNLLHERELKHGTKVTRGAIECALMTSNRYISEVLEGSRDNLLAFVDRIALIGFVPRGFANAGALDRVLRARVGRAPEPELTARLTIQDVDVLQAATESVHFPPPLVPRLTQLLSIFHEEVQAAVRADPTFVPTRYLSTRTAVRLGRLLKAIVVLDVTLGEADRDLTVRAEDFEKLRLSMILSGPEPEEIDRLLEVEADPRERAQLAIVRAEREIFDRCIERLPAPPRIPERRTAEPPPETTEARKELERALAEEKTAPEALLDLTKDLGEKVRAAGEGAELAEDVLDEATGALLERALRRGLAAGAGDEGSIDDVLDELDAIAAALDGSGERGAALARWLRGRSLELVGRALTTSPASLSALLPGEDTDADLPDAATTTARGDAAIARVGALLARRSRLVALGATAEEDEHATARVARELLRLGNVLAAAWDAAMVREVERLFAESAADDLDAVFDGLGPIFAEVSRHSARLGELGASRDLLREVCGPRLRPLLVAAFARFDATDRPSTSEEVDGLLSALSVAGLEGAVQPSHVIHLSAEALLRAEPEPPAADEIEATYEGYIELRNREQRTSLAVALVSVAERLARSGTLPADPEAVLELVGGIEADLRERILVTDLSRVDRALSRLESFWEAHPEDASPRERLRAVVRSKFFRLAIDDDALTRFALELDLLKRLFPSAASRVSPVTARLDSLRDECMAEVIALVKALSDERFDGVAAS